MRGRFFAAAEACTHIYIHIRNLSLFNRYMHARAHTHSDTYRNTQTHTFPHTFAE